MMRTLQKSANKDDSWWNSAPCSLVEVDRYIRGVCCLHHQGDDRPISRFISMGLYRAISQKLSSIVIASKDNNTSRTKLLLLIK
jgi:hypothetical protein